MRYGLGLSLVLTAALTGCLPSGSTLGGSALVHSRFPYAVAYDDVTKKSVLGDDWRLETYRKRSSPEQASQTEAADQPVEIERKGGFETKYVFDFDDDDKSDGSDVLPYPDLVFVHRKTNARLEVATVLLDERLAEKELRVLLQNIVDSTSGTRSLFVGFGQVAAGVEKHFASKLLDFQPASLGGKQGLVATIERADLDQLKLDPNARWRRSRLFLVRAPFDYYAAKLRDGGSVDYHRYGVLLMVEYSNTPEDFEAQYPEFVRLLNKTHLLTDELLLAYLGDQLSHCDGHLEQATVDVRVFEDGRSSVSKSEGIPDLCSTSVVTGYYFSATGKEHVVSMSYDFKKPQKPAWLTEATYAEQRATPSEAGKAPAAPAPTGNREKPPGEEPGPGDAAKPQAPASTSSPTVPTEPGSP